MPRPFQCSRCHGTDPNCYLCHEAEEDRRELESAQPDSYREWVENELINEPSSSPEHSPTTDRHG